jgi:hydrogenase maturation factor
VNADRAIAALVESQYGLFTRAQARSRGLSRGMCSHRLVTGEWVAVHRGVYRLAGSPRTLEQSMKAACLAVPGAVASHRAAAWLLSLPDIKPRVEITVLQSQRVAVGGVEIHRTTRLDAVDRDCHRGIPVTSLALTVINLSELLGEAELEALLDHVLARRRLPLS